MNYQSDLNFRAKTTGKENSGESNRQSFYEAMNRFVKTQPDTFAEDFQPVIRRQFVWREKNFNLIIRAAQFPPDKFPVGFYFLAERERAVEQALRVLATPENPHFDAQEMVLIFSLGQLTKTLDQIKARKSDIEKKPIEHIRTVAEKDPAVEDEIKFSLDALALTAFTLQSEDKELIFYSIERLESSERNNETYYRALLSGVVSDSCPLIEKMFDI